MVLIVFLAHDAICVAVSASDHLPFILAEKRDTGSENMRHHQLSLSKRRNIMTVRQTDHTQ
jgi:hypothetical protein